MTYILEDRLKTRKAILRLSDLSQQASRALQLNQPMPEQTLAAIRQITQTSELHNQADALMAMSEDLRKKHLARLLPLAQDEFTAFCEYVNFEEAPGSEWHIWLTKKLQEIEYDPDLTRFILNCPPGHAKPLHVDTPVLMANGLSRRLGDVKVGDEVITDKGRARKVTAVHEQGTLPLLKLTTKKGRVVHTAYDHSFRVIKDGEKLWTKAEDLLPGDKLQIVSGLRDPKKFRDQPARKKEAVALSAAFTALGSNLKLKSANFRIWVPPEKLQIIEDVLTAAKVKYRKAFCESNKRYLVRMHTTTLKPYLAYLYTGEYMSDRVVPLWVQKSSDDKVKTYLTVLLGLKGSILRSGGTVTVKMQFANRDHALGVSRLLNRIAVDNVVTETSPAGKTGVKISGHALADLLRAGVNFQNLDPEDVMPFRVAHVPYTEDEVVSIEPIDAGECRCLTVAEDHTFLANNIVVHNSTYASRLFVAWRLGRNPNLKIIGGGHSQRFVENEFSAKIRNLVRSPEFKAIFPELKVSHETAAKDQWAIAGKNGQYAAKGVGQAVHGFRANFVCVDDPYAKIEEAESPVQREKVETWFVGDLGSRMLPGGKIFLIMTRFHEEDLTGYLLNQNKILPSYAQWYHVEAPALCIDPETDILHRQIGEVLWDYYNHSYFNVKRREWSFQRFSLVYQQNPSAVSNDSISGQFRYYEVPPHLAPEAIKKAKEAGQIDKRGKVFTNKREYYRRIIVSVDTASKVNQRTDYTVVQTWAETNDFKYYLLAQTRKKVEFNDMIGMIERQAKKTDADLILIEDKGQGTAYIQNRGSTPSQRRQAPCPIVAFDPLGQSKEFRFDEVSPLIVAGDVFLPKYADYLDAYVKEFGQFPAGAHDDQVDATTQALKFLKGNRTKYGSRKVKKFG